MSENLEGHAPTLEDIRGLQPRASLGLAARAALRVAPTLETPSSTSPDDTAELIEAVDICVWCAGLVAFVGPDALPAAALTRSINTARSIIARSGRDPEWSQRYAPGAAIQAAAAAAALLASQSSRESTADEDLPSENGLPDLTSSVWESVQLASSVGPRFIATANAQATGSDLELLRQSNDVYALGNEPLWPKAAFAALDVDADGTIKELDGLLSDWHDRLKSLGLERLYEHHQQVRGGGFDWEIPFTWIDDWGKRHGVLLTGPEPEEPSKTAQSAVRRKAEKGADKIRGLDPTATDAGTLVLQRGDTAIRVQVHDKIWTLGFDALVIPTDAEGHIDGKFATASFKYAGREVSTKIARAVEEHGQIGPDEPLAVSLDDVSIRKTFPSTIIVATAWSERFAPEHAGRAVVAAARLASERGLPSLATPLLGTGRGGLEERSVLTELLRALARAAPFPGLRDLTISTLNAHLPELAREIASRITDRRFGPAPDRAIVDSDQRTKDDSLRVGDQARTFAKLLAARDVNLPISIGLFGNWGVGKTFFMKLMQEEIDKLTAEQSADNPNSTYVRRAAQIEFNAWHYVDTNLWASLAIRLFDGLVKEYAPDGASDDDIEDLRRQLRAEVESSERAKQRAKERQAQAQDERQKATLDLESLQAQRTEAAKEYGKVYWKRFLKKIGGTKRDNLKRAQEVATDLGLDAVIETGDDAVQLYRELKRLQGRWEVMLMALGQRFSTLPRAALTLTIIGALLGAAIAAGPVLEWIYSTVQSSPSPVWAEILDLVARATALVGPVVAWVGTKLKSVSEVTGYLEQVQAQLAESDPAQGLDDEAAKAERELRAKLDSLDAEIKTHQEKIKESERRIKRAQAELQRIDGGGLVYDFLVDRRVDPEYSSRLGVISVIRQDFERLGKLLDDWNRHHANGQPPIERIILYVDDLDRCHPDQVVEVLQAVHLLLAFDLFAVVVAVDPRWLERSLYKAYVPDVTWAQTSHTPSRSSEEFSPQNYLEKIFQIPFSLESMRPDGYERLINSIVETRSEREKRLEEERLNAEKQRQLESQARTRTEEKRKSDEQPGETPAIAREEDSDKQAGLAASQSEGKPSAEPAGAQSPQQRGESRTDAAELSDRRPTDLEADALQKERHDADPVLEDWEQQFLQALHPFVETPRLAKRMVNIYRLLRVRAGTMSQDFVDFIDPDQGDYRAALILLAMNIGHPEISARVLRSIETSDQKSFRLFIETASLESKREKPQELPLLASSDRERESLVRLMNRLEETKGYLGKAKTPVEFPDDLNAFRTWAPEVGRYSFHWNLS